MNDPETFERTVVEIVAGTFGVPVSRVGRSTTAGDIDGWDSLGHSVLLARLSQKLALPIGEEIASSPENVGELSDLLWAERQKTLVIAREGDIGNVIEGGDGRLFLGDQDGFSTQWFISPKPFTFSLVEVWRRTLRRRAREFARRNVPYVFCVVPDAHFVYPELLPPEFDAANLKAPGDVFLAEMSELRDIVLINPRAALVESKGLLDVYRKADTHPSQYGAFVAYRAMAEVLKTIVPMSVIEARDVTYHLKSIFGDLGVRVSPERNEQTPRANVTRNPHVTVFENEGYKRTGSKETYAPDAAPTRALFFRDSFFSDQFEYIARSFRNMFCAGTTTTMFLDEIDAWRPDIVVSHVGERRLYAYQGDHRRDNFDDTFRSDFSSPRGRKVRTACLQLDAGQKHEALANVVDFETDPGIRPDHAYTLARALMAAGESERAARAIAIALSSFPRRASYLSVAAQVEFIRGDFRTALELAERAIDAAPFNGYHHNTYAYLLLESREPARAKRYLDLVLREIDDFAPLYLLDSLACERTGDLIGATESIVQAVLLDSSSIAVKNQAGHLWRS